MTTDLPADERSAAIAAFIKKHGVKRCPTACAVATQASIPAADRAALDDYARDRERRRQSRAVARVRSLGVAPPQAAE